MTYCSTNLIELSTRVRNSETIRYRVTTPYIRIHTVEQLSIQVRNARLPTRPSGKGLLCYNMHLITLFNFTSKEFSIAFSICIILL